MNSLKPLVMLIVLLGVGFGVYRWLNKGPAEPPPGTDTTATGPLEIKLGESGALAERSAAPKAAAPNLLRPAGESSAPPFQAQRATTGPTAGLSNSAAPVNTASPYAGYADHHHHDHVHGHSHPGATASPEVRTPQESVAAPAATSAATSPAAAADPAAFATAWAMIRPKLAAGQLDEALKDLTPWQEHPSLTPSEREWLRRLLGELAGTVIYSREHTLTEPYRVRAGDRFEEIAERFKVSVELLAKINGLDPARPIELRPGDDLKIVPGPFSATVDLSAQRLILELDGRYAGSFPLAQIGAAAGEKMPAGSGRAELSVTQKTVTPIYNGPRGEVEADDPSNPLGQHLLGLGNELALHGTNPKASPQAAQPAGGIRMNAEDIAEVYDILTVGSRVTVRR